MRTQELWQSDDAPAITKLVSEKELMGMLRLSRTTLWRLRSRGLPTVTVGRGLRYNVESVQQWLEETQQSLEASPEPGQHETGVHQLPDCHWSLSVALDPKHRPQEVGSPSSTVRREWWRYPQEAHLLDRAGARYRRLTADEIGCLQGFPKDWGRTATKDELLLIRGYGDAVPPTLAEQIAAALPMLAPPSGIRTSVEICAGFGGLALGKSRALGVEHLALMERWPVACEVLRTCGAFPPDRVREVDLATYDWSEFAGRVDLLSGGPPCQPWSQGGRGLGEADERDLLGSMPEAVGLMRPSIFVFENVLGLLSGDNATYAQDLVDRLRNAAGPNSYGVAIAAFNSADFGVPQKRRRVFIVGAAGRRTSEILKFFDAVHARKTHGNPRHSAQHGLIAWQSIGEAIPDWHEDKRQWYRWPQSPAMETESRVDAKATVGSSLGNAEPLRRAVRIGLDWPSRGLRARLDGKSEWVIEQERESPALSATIPLLPHEDRNAVGVPWYVHGDPMIALDALRRSLGRRAKLTYIDVPRIRTNAKSFDASERETVIDTWLTVVHGLLRRGFSLLGDDGALVALCGIEETHYVRLLLDEIAGPKNHLGTVAWQKGYSPRNMKNMREVSPTHDNLILFARRKESLPPLALKVPADGFKNADGDPRGAWNAEQKGANKADCDYEVNICPYRWRLLAGRLPPGLWRLNEKSGVIWGRGQDIDTPGTWKFQVEVVDQDGQASVREFEISIGTSAPAPEPAAIPWLASIDGLDRSGPLRVVTKTLPAGRIGADYSACIIAAGGEPWTGTTRPGKTATGGKGRYWEYPLKTLLRAAAEDRVDYKSRDDAIPAIKSYLQGASHTPLNQMSVWLGSAKKSTDESAADVGYAQDAKKELGELQEAGVISQISAISKPSKLMGRLLALFDSEEGVVIDIGSPAAEMASVATAMGRRAIYVELSASREERYELLLKRMNHASQGKHQLPAGVCFSGQDQVSGAFVSGYLVSGSPRAPDGGRSAMEMSAGNAFAQVDRSTGVCSIDYKAYPEGSAAFLSALASVEGLIPFGSVRDGEPFAASVSGDILAIHVPSRTRVDARYLDTLPSTISEHLHAGGRLRIYYHRGLAAIEHAFGSRIELLRIPYDLRVSVGID